MALAEGGATSAAETNPAKQCDEMVDDDDDDYDTDIKKNSLLYHAIHLKDTTAVRVIVNCWIRFLTTKPKDDQDLFYQRFVDTDGDGSGGKRAQLSFPDMLLLADRYPREFEKLICSIKLMPVQGNTLDDETPFMHDDTDNGKLQLEKYRPSKWELQQRREAAEAEAEEEYEDFLPTDITTAVPTSLAPSRSGSTTSVANGNASAGAAASGGGGGYSAVARNASLASVREGSNALSEMDSDDDDTAVALKPAVATRRRSSAARRASRTSDAGSDITADSGTASASAPAPASDIFRRKKSTDAGRPTSVRHSIVPGAGTATGFLSNVTNVGTGGIGLIEDGFFDLTSGARNAVVSGVREMVGKKQAETTFLFLPIENAVHIEMLKVKQ